MRIYRDLNELAEFSNSVVTIGTFDGVHLGHQKILKKVQNEAADINGESILFTFYPHPRMVVFLLSECFQKRLEKSLRRPKRSDLQAFDFYQKLNLSD